MELCKLLCDCILKNDRKNGTGAHCIHSAFGSVSFISFYNLNPFYACTVHCTYHIISELNGIFELKC